MTLMGSIELKLTKTEVRTKVVNVKLMESIQATLKMEMRMKVMDLTDLIQTMLMRMEMAKLILLVLHVQTVTVNH